MANSPSYLSLSHPQVMLMTVILWTHAVQKQTPPFKKPSCLWRLILRHVFLLAHAYGQVCGHVPSYFPPAHSPSCRFYQAGVRNNICNFQHASLKKNSKSFFFPTACYLSHFWQAENIGVLNGQVEISYKYVSARKSANDIGGLVAF